MSFFCYPRLASPASVAELEFVRCPATYPMSKRLIFVFVLAVLVCAATTYRSALDHLSCAGCRSFRFVTTRSVFGVEFWHSEEVRLSANVPPGHVHRWWRFSLHTDTAFSTTFACKAKQFEDGREPYDQPNQSLQPTAGADARTP